jgi:hypothetical protein
MVARFYRSGCGAPSSKRPSARASPCAAAREFSYLFDLAADPRETADLSARRPKEVAALEQALAQWESQMSEPAWEPRLTTVPACGQAFDVAF